MLKSLPEPEFVCYGQKCSRVHGFLLFMELIKGISESNNIHVRNDTFKDTFLASQKIGFTLK